MSTELRVHGVSGTPPASLLYTEPVSYDLGPDMARVFEPNRDTWDVKAFHWGSLTSRNALTAFWILLAPFAMANVAGWMSEQPNVWSRIWIRVAGLALTGILFAQAANAAFEVPASSGVATSTATTIYISFCILFVLGLGLLSTQSSFKTIGLLHRLRYIVWPTIAAMNPMRSAEDWSDPAGSARLVGTKMWGVHSLLHRLRRLHLTFGMSVLAVVAARKAEQPSIEATALVAAGVTLVVLGLTAGRLAQSRLVLVVTSILPLVGAAVLTWSLVVLSGWTGGGPVNVADDLTYQLALILAIAAGATLTGEAIATGLRGGLVPVGLLAIATLIGATYGLTGSMLVETYLLNGATTGSTFDGGAGFVTIGMLGLVLITALTFAVCMILPKRGDHTSALRRGVLRARITLGVAGVYGIVVGGLAAFLSCSGDDGCSQANIGTPGWMTEDAGSIVVLLGLPFDPSSVLGWAKILMIAVPAFLIVRSILGGLLNGQDARRRVGIVWDLGSFWPRWFHPLAPPAYGPYAVTRLQTTLDEVEPDVLAAHSQGSVISAVAISLTDFDKTPAKFISYGSQIGDLYPTLFPGVGFDELTTTTLKQLDGQWINLWRSSDPIGGQVIDALNDQNWEVKTGTGHGRYELTPEFCAARKTGLDRPPDADMANCWETPDGDTIDYPPS